MRDRQRIVKDPWKMRRSNPSSASPRGAASSHAQQSEREWPRQREVDSWVALHFRNLGLPPPATAWWCCTGRFGVYPHENPGRDPENCCYRCSCRRSGREPTGCSAAPALAVERRWGGAARRGNAPPAGLLWQAKFGAVVVTISSDCRTVAHE